MTRFSSRIDFFATLASFEGEGAGKVPKIPIPFIGGGGGLKRTTAFDTRFPVPFHPEMEATGEGFLPLKPEGYGLEAAAEILPDLAVEESQAPVDSGVAGSHEGATSPIAAANEALVEADERSLEPPHQAGGDSQEQAPWDEEPGADRVLLGMVEEESPEVDRAPDRTPLEFAADVWGEDVGTPELTGLAGPAADETIAEPERAFPAEGIEPETHAVPAGQRREPVDSTPARPPERAGTEQVELPDFLRILDADREGGADYEEPGLVARHATDLSDLALELLAGEHGEGMRALMDTLREEDAESAIARAFAAGYRAAREGQGE